LGEESGESDESVINAALGDSQFMEKNYFYKLMNIILPRFTKILKNHLQLSRIVDKLIEDSTALDKVHSPFLLFVVLISLTKQQQTPIYKRDDTVKVRKYFSSAYTIETIWKVMESQLEQLLELHLVPMKTETVLKSDTRQEKVASFSLFLFFCS
jgi:hypothetical protein